jgi:hypothetical protein
LVVFQAVNVGKATNDERKQLQEARKAQKFQAKQRRAFFRSQGVRHSV